MIKFLVKLGSNLKEGTAATVEKAQEFLKLIFAGKQAFVVDGDTVRIALNMTMDEAQSLNPYKPATPPAPPAPVVRASVPKKSAKKNKVKAKAKPNKKKVKAKAKVKVKPKAKKAKAKVKPKPNKSKKKVKAKVKARR